MSWNDDVLAAMRQLNGPAQISTIYMLRFEKFVKILVKVYHHQQMQLSEGYSKSILRILIALSMMISIKCPMVKEKVIGR